MDITIRRAEPSDYEAIAAILGDPAVFPNTLQLPLPSREMWRKRLAEPAEGDVLLVAQVGDQVVGQAGLHSGGTSRRRSHVMVLGIVVLGPWQGKGIGRALMKEILAFADGWLNVFRIELNVFADNQKAIALYKEFGFEQEGLHRAHALRDGHYADSVSMARLKPKPSAV